MSGPYWGACFLNCLRIFDIDHLKALGALIWEMYTQLAIDITDVLVRLLHIIKETVWAMWFNGGWTPSVNANRFMTQSGHLCVSVGHGVDVKSLAGWMIKCMKPSTSPNPYLPIIHFNELWAHYFKGTVYYCLILTILCI